MKHLTFFFLYLITFVTFAQKPIEVVNANYKMVLQRNTSMEELETQCLEQAKLRAIEKECGARISEVTINNVGEKNGGVNQNFQSLTKTQVNGEWIRDTKVPAFIWTCAGGTLELETMVSGIIQKFPEEGRVKLNLLTATDRAFKNKTTKFNDGSNLYLQVQASQKGYLSTYYVDNVANKVYRLFPGPNNNNMDMVPMKSDMVYTLFSGPTEFPEHPQSSELTAGLSSVITPQIDEIVVIYTETELKKPLLEFDSISKLYTLSIQDFYSWKANLYSKNNQVTVGSIPITIE